MAARTQVDARSRGAVRRVIGRASWLSRLRVILRNRPDSEHEMTINRLVIIGAVLAYLTAAASMGQEESANTLKIYGFFFGVCYVISIGLFAHIIFRPQVSSTRRMIAIAIDMSMLTVGMHVGGEATALLYPIFLWIILGNGFRFGVRYLVAATVAAVSGFGAVLITTDFWLQLPTLGWGLLAGLIVIPAYASTLVRKLSKAKHQAEQASKAKSLFLASVSHELRTPLNAVIALSDLLKGTRLDREQIDMVGTIGDSGRSLLSLINSILDFSRLEAGRMPVRAVNFDLIAALRHVERVLAVQAQLKGVDLSLHLHPDTPRLVKGDPRHIEEILLNLGGNAVKFTAQGSVTIAVADVEAREGGARLRCEVIDTGIGIAPEAQERIFESFTQADESIIDRFGGTGLGLAIVRQLVEQIGGEIGLVSALGQGSTFWFVLDLDSAEAAQEQLPQEPFTDALLVVTQDRALEAICSQITTSAICLEDLDTAVDLISSGWSKSHGVVLLDARNLGVYPARAVDRLRAASSARLRFALVRGKEASSPPTREEMSCFRCIVGRPLDAGTLRRVIDFSAATSAIGPEESVAHSAQTRSLKVLVAEDNRTNQKVIAKLLEKDGHVVEIVENGEEAVDALNLKTFDIVLMDINMPVLNGVEATKLHRFAAIGRPRTPIFALTADVSEETRRRCMEAGMDGCLGKPIEIARLREVFATIDDGRAVPVEPDTDESEDRKPIASEDASEDAISPRMLKDLVELGGEDFVHDLVGQFVGDANSVLRELAQSVALGDASAFREQAHALRSGAANIGARRIYEMCLSWRKIEPRELAIRGEDHVRRLEQEFQEVRRVLESRFDGVLKNEAPQPAPIPPIIDAVPTRRKAANG